MHATVDQYEVGCRAQRIDQQLGGLGRARRIGTQHCGGLFGTDRPQLGLHWLEKLLERNFAGNGLQQIARWLDTHGADGAVAATVFVDHDHPLTAACKRSRRADQQRGATTAVAAGDKGHHRRRPVAEQAPQAGRLIIDARQRGIKQAKLATIRARMTLPAATHPSAVYAPCCQRRLLGRDAAGSCDLADAGPPAHVGRSLRRTA